MTERDEKTQAVDQRAIAGDPVAFGAVLRQHDAALRGVVWSVVRKAASLDDVMQDAYERAFAAIDTFEGRSTLKTWLHSICYRTAIDHVRYEGRRRHEVLHLVADTAASDSTSGSALDAIALAEALERLDSEQRALIMLTAGLGYSYDETAEIVGLARGTVASRVSRARSQLRELHATDEGDMS